MHRAGINHRDLYICHFLMHVATSDELTDKNKVRLFLIDLHRAQIRKNVPTRWIVKDIAGLYFSAMDIGLTKRDCYRFVRIYSGLSLREASQNYEFWSKVNVKALTLYKKVHAKDSPNAKWWF